MGCVLALHSYCGHVERTQSCLVLQSSLDLDSITAKLLYTNSEMSTVPLGGKYLSEIEAVGTSPACVYAWIAKYVPLNEFQLTFFL